MEETQNSTPRDRIAETAEPVRQVAAEAKNRGRGAVADQIGTRSVQLGGQMTQAAQTLRTAADQASQQGNDPQARVISQAAQRVDRMGGYLSNVDPDELLSDAEDYARREPWVVAGVGLLLGFVVARSVKASSSRRYQARSAPRRASSQRLPERLPDGRAGEVVYAGSEFPR